MPEITLDPPHTPRVPVQCEGRWKSRPPPHPVQHVDRSSKPGGVDKSWGSGSTKVIKSLSDRDLLVWIEGQQMNEPLIPTCLKNNIQMAAVWEREQ